MRKIEIMIEGMSCHHCVKTVKEAFDNAQGINNLEVHIGSLTADIDDIVDVEEVMDVIRYVGYTPTLILN